jgi:pantoate kinase
MATVLGRGTCGGHVTLLFTVDDLDDDPIRQGSLGAGLCLADGSEAVARGETGDYSLRVRFLDGDGDTRMFQQVLDLLKDEIIEFGEMSWDISIRNHLPSSQGFGMSAAGAVAAAAAFQRALGLPHEESLRRSYMIAHRIERANSTGLGDVTALAAGGVERRLAPGSPYSGEKLDNGPGRAEGWSEGTPVVLAWRSSPGRHTSEYINHPDWKRLISEAGQTQMDCLAEGEWDASRWKELLDSAEAFASDSRLIDDAARTTLLEYGQNACERAGLSAQTAVLLCMLGESIAIVPRDLTGSQQLESLLAELEKEGLESTLTRIGQTA